jgi:hypothetical protein
MSSAGRSAPRRRWAGTSTAAAITQDVQARIQLPGVKRRLGAAGSLQVDAGHDLELVEHAEPAMHRQWLVENPQPFAVEQHEVARFEFGRRKIVELAVDLCARWCGGSGGAVARSRLDTTRSV